MSPLPAPEPSAEALVVMGVSGSGKTTLGRALAARLGWAFFDADDFHPPGNVAKMRAGVPLTDADRAPWLARLHALLAERLAAGEPLVLACSALKASYRAALAEGLTGRLRFVYLSGEPGLIARRLRARRGHYMPAALLESQFAALEPPQDALVVDAAAPTAAQAEAVLAELGLSP